MSEHKSPSPAATWRCLRTHSVGGLPLEPTSDDHRLVRDLDLQEVEVPGTADALAHFFSDL
jgi:hypothetical protein